MVRGPFLFLSDEKLAVKGVTYGTFSADERGDLFPPRETVREDFAAMRKAGVNTIRTYTPPPDWLFEEARAAGLRILVGIYWDDRNCTLDDPAHLEEAKLVVREAVARCKNFPDVVLAYVIGNEVPALVARFHGRKTVERVLRGLYDVAKTEDPGGLVTYGNYPSTEYLQLEFLDFYTLNVYLLDRDVLSRYLDRMLIQAKGKPLLLGEAGDDSLGKGEDAQAELLDWTIPLVLDKCCGVCVFSWTDDWVVGGARIEDWAFGVVDVEREPKPAYHVLARRFSESPFDRRRRPWPRVSVVVCNYNGGETLDETLSSLEELDYPDHEIIFVDDGSTDDSLDIGRRHADKVRVISRRNEGLSVARNVGARAATGEIVAYIDSDAYADRDWLRYLVISMESGDFAGSGGPNLTPASDGLSAQFIALCPGNPTYVLRDNVRAEHLAGVNMAFRREVLLSLGGFDPVHTKAGDDVDICWRFEDAGRNLAFSPTAIVWHHRRPSIWRFVKQQLGYGEAENQLERKHPERFNLGGYIRWAGRVYLAPRRVTGFLKPFIYHGHLGTGLFQTLYQKDPSSLMDSPRMIHWYLLWAVLLALSPFSLPLLPVGLTLLAMSLWGAFLAGLTTEVPVNLNRREQAKKVWVIGLLHFLHPVLRWWGRLSAALRNVTPPKWVVRTRWLRPGPILRELRLAARRRREIRRYWGPGSSNREDILRAIREELKSKRTSTTFGQDWDDNDLLLNGSLVAQGRFYTAPEHYDQSLCCGFRSYTTGLARILLLLMGGGSLAATYLDVRLSPVFAVPLLTILYALGQRARLRTRIWQAVDAVMEGQGAKRFDG